MSINANFISELVRVANEVERLTDFEKCRLLKRAVTTAGDMREQAGVAASRTIAEALIDLQSIAALAAFGRAPDERVANALLNVAGMIRTLKIILEAREEISKGEHFE